VNLNQVAGIVTSVVSPTMPVTVRVSTGNQKNADATLTPTYAPPVTVSAQVQPLTWRDIQQMDALNLQGTRKAIYLNGQVNGIVRATNRGGDLIQFPDGSTWLVCLVAEGWENANWCKVLVTLQDGS
jgi:hypothetical protein